MAATPEAMQQSQEEEIKLEQEALYDQFIEANKADDRQKIVSMLSQGFNLDQFLKDYINLSESEDDDEDGPTYTLPGIVGLAFLGFFTTVDILLDQGADINTRGPDGSTALHWAATTDIFSRRLEDQRIEGMQLLLRRGANPEIKNAKGKTPLYLAAASPNLLKSDASFSRINSSYRPQLQLLLDWGANINNKDSLEQDASEIAEAYKETQENALLLYVYEQQKGRPLVPESVISLLAYAVEADLIKTTHLLTINEKVLGELIQKHIQESNILARPELLQPIQKAFNDFFTCDEEDEDEEEDYETGVTPEQILSFYVHNQIYKRVFRSLEDVMDPYMQACLQQMQDKDKDISRIEAMSIISAIPIYPLKDSLNATYTAGKAIVDKLFVDSHRVGGIITLINRYLQQACVADGGAIQIDGKALLKKYSQEFNNAKPKAFPAVSLYAIENRQRVQKYMGRHIRSTVQSADGSLVSYQFNSGPVGEVVALMDPASTAAAGSSAAASAAAVEPSVTASGSITIDPSRVRFFR